MMFSEFETNVSRPAHISREQYRATFAALEALYTDSDIMSKATVYATAEAMFKGIENDIRQRERRRQLAVKREIARVETLRAARMAEAVIAFEAVVKATELDDIYQKSAVYNGFERLVAECDKQLEALRAEL